MAHAASFNLDEVPLYGSSRVGVYVPSAGGLERYRYELTDHLGNVRVVFSPGAGTAASTRQEGYDYFPYGLETRSYVARRKHVRYGYQGQYSHYDDDLQMNRFDLIDYDPTIRRWLTTDPMNAGFTPYWGMNNNPVIGVDPTSGACETCPKGAEYNGARNSKMNFTYGDGGLMLQEVSFKAKGSLTYSGKHKISSELPRQRLGVFAKRYQLDIVVVSGDRDPDHNKEVGAAPNSRHLYRDGADIQVAGMANADLSQLAYESQLFNTVILYPKVNVPDALRPHAHVDMNPNHSNLLLKYTPYRSV